MLTQLYMYMYMCGVNQYFAYLFYMVNSWHRYARKETAHLFDPFKAFDYIESNHETYLFLIKDKFFFMRAQHVLSYHLI